MASMHICIKSGKPGKAAAHADYIVRRGRFGKGEKVEDLVSTGHGNLPPGIDRPEELWAAADRGERKNGAAYRELVLALPTELTLSQSHEMVEVLIDRELRGKPYQFAIHCPNAALSSGHQPHAHIMFSDRILDGICRKPEAYFRRHNAKNPEQGGLRKDSGGLDPITLKQQVIKRRESWATLQNEYLAKHGHGSRVDHRSNRDRGIGKEPERHLGPAVIRTLTDEQKDAIRKSRQT